MLTFTINILWLLWLSSGSWLCSLCRDLTDPDRDDRPEPRAVKEEPDCPAAGFLPLDKRKCERLLLRLFCSELSVDFGRPLDPAALADKRRMTLATVSRRLASGQSPAYRGPADLVSDLRVVFRTWETYYQADSEGATATGKLERLFEEQLKILFPDRPFPEIKREQPEPPPAPLSVLLPLERWITDYNTQNALSSPEARHGTG